jgi:tetratricopeptide (TPR) repeat protein
MAESHRDEIAKLESLYENNPDGRVFTHLAEAYRKAGELDRARDTVERGLTRHPEYSSAHVVLGRVLLDQGDRSGAAQAFERVLELDRHNLIALKALAESKAEEGDIAGALGHYRELEALDAVDERLRSTIARLEDKLDASDVEPAPFEPFGAGPDEAFTEVAAVDEPPPSDVSDEPDTVAASVDGGASSDPSWREGDESMDRSAQGDADEGDEPGDREAAPETFEPVDWEAALASDRPSTPGDLAAFAKPEQNRSSLSPSGHPQY